MKLDRGMSALATERDRLVKRLRNSGNNALAEQLSAVALDWYRIKNSAEDNDTTEIFVYDTIGGWFGVDAAYFVQELNEITTKNIKVRINSPGGSVFDSVAIYNALISHPANIHVVVDSLAASGASIIAMGGDTVTMMVGSQMMIHDAAMYTGGNASDLRADADWLEGQSQNIANIYAHHVGGTADEMREMMLAETWMFADEAVKLGFATDVYTGEGSSETADSEEDSPAEEEIPEEETEDVANLMNVRHTLTNRGFKFTGRSRAPEPVRVEDEIDVDQIIAGFNKVLGRK